MSESQIAGHFIIGLNGPELTPDEKYWLEHFGAAGIVFFSRNIENPQQLARLMHEIKDLCLCSPNAEPPLFCIDMEGGRISELKHPNFRSWPSPSQYLKQNPTTSLYEFGLDMGTYLRELGFHVNFSPCLDTLTNLDNHLIKDRSLGETSQQVVFLGKDLIRGFMDAKILTTAKHFPGHGHTLADSHFELPVDNRPFSELETDSLPPFKMASQMGVPFFMTAHVVYTQVDPDWPATLSEVWLKKILRDSLGVTQFCLADDLDMKALSSFGNSNQLAARFFNCGGDFIMYCHRETPPFEILDYLQSHIDSNEKKRMESAKKTLSRIKLAFL